MSQRTRCLVAVTLPLLFTLPVAAQLGAGSEPPTLKGVWNPVIGSGAEYKQTAAGETYPKVSIAVIGKEDVNGSPGYWIEYRYFTPQGQQDWMQALIYVNGSRMEQAKTILTMPGRGPVQIDGGVGGRANMARQQARDIRESADRVGNERVTTPAGSFDCEHWRSKDGTTDLWISSKVTPWALVKMDNRSGKPDQVILEKVLTDQKSHIMGTPQRVDPSVFDRAGQ